LKFEKIDHIGIVVKSAAERLKLYRDVFELNLSNAEELDDRGLKVYFLEIGDTRLELLEPISDKSEITNFLEKKGEGIHHIAFSVSNIEQVVEKCKDKGFKIISGIQIGAEGKKVAFLHPKSTGGVLIELVENRK